MANEMSWGERWLRMMPSADRDARVKRGWSYFCDGAVVSFSVADGKGEAVVRGNQDYQVTFLLPRLSEVDRDTIVQSLQATPRLLDLLQRRIYEQYWHCFLYETGIPLFPDSYTELAFSCDCPDAVALCKHIAAVVFYMSSLLDENPFLLFEWQGLDVLSALREAGMQAVAEVPLPELRSSLDMLEVSSEPLAETPACDWSPDFSVVPNGGAALLALLPKRPPFAERRDFRNSYKQCFSQLTRKAADQVALFQKGQVVPSAFAIDKGTDIHLLVDHALHVSVSCDSVSEGRALSLSTLPLALAGIGEGAIRSYRPSVQWLWLGYRFVAHLVAKGMFQCQWVSLPGGLYRAVWSPSLLSSEVASLYDEWVARFPLGILFLDGSEAPLAEPGAWALRLLLSAFIHSCNLTVSLPVDRVFFKGTQAKAGTGHEEVPRQIQGWLDHQHPVACRYRPRLVVEESDYGGYLSLQIVDSEKAKADPIRLFTFMTDRAYASERMPVYEALRALMYLRPSLQELVESKGRTKQELDDRELLAILEELLPQARLIGVTALLPKSLERLLRPKVVAVTRKSCGSGQLLTLDYLLSFDVQVALGEHQVPLKDFLKMVERAEGLLRYRGKYFVYDEAFVARMRRLSEGLSHLTPAEALAVALTGELAGEPILLPDELRKSIRELSQVGQVPLPEGLRATLRPYQVRGYAWLYKNARCGIGSILADDMGLGKTLQVIALLMKIKEEQGGRFLVIVPTGLLSNWRREVERFAPALSVWVYHGNGRSLEGYESGIVLTSYSTARNSKDALMAFNWDVIVLDEAQQIKNCFTGVAMAVLSFKGRVRIAMSGTPVENKLSELWSIMQFVNPGLLGSLNSFSKRFIKPIQRQGDTGLSERLRLMTAPFVMRRLKSDRSIISDLPDKVERNEYVSLVAEQAALYQSTVNRALGEINQLPEDGDARVNFKRKGLVLQMILDLKQICNHPAQFLKEGEADAKRSGKLAMLLNLCEEIIAAGEKVLVFTQYKEMGELIERALTERFGRSPLFYHGSLSVKKREELVRRFQEVPDDQVLIVTLKAAGTGLNLTAASHVIHYDLWWNPAVESQATDRAYRIGQHKNVQVHRFITEGTFEERIDAMISRKKALADMTVATGEQWIGKLSNRELMDLFAS